MNLLRFFGQVFKSCTPEQAATDKACSPLPNIEAGPDQLKTILGIAFGIIGVAAVIYMMLAGMKFVTSQGNPEQAAKARQSIIYGAIGLLVAASAETILFFVLGRL